MGYAHVNVLLQSTGKDQWNVSTSPKEVEVTKSHKGIKWHADFEQDFEVIIKDKVDLHFDMGKKSGKKKKKYKTKIKGEHNNTTKELDGSYSVFVFDDEGNVIAEKDPDYIIRPRG